MPVASDALVGRAHEWTIAALPAPMREGASESIDAARRVTNDRAALALVDCVALPAGAVPMA